MKKTETPFPPLASWPKTKTPWRIRSPFYFETFNGLSFSDYSEFKVEITRLKELTNWRWNLDKIVYRRGTIAVRMTYRLHPNGDVIEGIVELDSDNGKYFTSGELFFKAHNAHVEISKGNSGSYTGGLFRRTMTLDEIEPDSPVYSYSTK